MKERQFTLKNLCERLMEEKMINAKNLAGARSTVHYWLKNETLILRRRPHSGWYILTQAEIDQIVIELSPGGKGYFHANEQ